MPRFCPDPEELEAALFNGHNGLILIRILPAFYSAVNLPDREARLARVQQRAVQLMIKEKQFKAALVALATMDERQPKLEAICHEGLGDFRAAAECHVAAGNPKDALACYRSVPDFEASLRLIRQIGEHPAAESLEWIARMQELVDQRPEKFGRTVTDPEKKLLQDMLERVLGVTRKKPAAKKPATKRTAAKKAAATRKRATAKAAGQKR